MTYLYPHQLSAKLIEQNKMDARSLIKLDDCRNRHNAKRALKISDYDIVRDGIKCAKPQVAYKLITAYQSRVPLVGIELEIENLPSEIDQDYRERVKDALTPLDRQYYCCADGSLIRGLEIVTAPSALSTLRSQYHKYYQALNNLKKLGLTSHDSGRCGLHVHVSKCALTNDQWIALISFVLRHKAFFKTLSRRENCGFCEFKKSNTSRYVAINVSNRDTVEFRFFRGTLLPSSFLASLDIILSLISFFSASRSRYTIRSYRAHIEDNYKLAAKYCADKWPSPQPRRVLTEAEKQARALAQAEKQLRLYNYRTQLIATLSSDISSRAAYELRFAHRLSARDGDTMCTVTLPVTINGRWPREMRAALNNASLLAHLTVPERCLPELASQRVIATRTCGWGRVNYYTRVVTRVN